MELLDFIQGLTCEGETVLVVKQKPILRDGELQFHADGAVVCTWPAFRPDARAFAKAEGAGESWYVNTASYIEKRFKDGKPSASAANCEFILFAMLDDIGTKSRVPQIAPTWVIETSPDNFQYGYAFDPESAPKKAAFAAAIRAIANAGYTDSGACNPVRNVRLPGSVNIKPGKNSFAARLTDFEPTRLFTLESLCEGLGVDLNAALAGVDANTRLGIMPMRLTDDSAGADDAVFAWLGSKGLVFSAPNHEGWAAVCCPNHAEHTDGNPEARYRPSNRAFCCMHSHCGDISSQVFLDWVAAQEGGPSCDYGTRPDLLAQTMTPALVRLGVNVAGGEHGGETGGAAVGDLFTTSAAQDVARVAQEEESREARAESLDSAIDLWFEEFAYMLDGDRYFHIPTRRFWSRVNFDAVYRHLHCRSIKGVDAGGKPRVVEASRLFDELRVERNGLVLEGLIYAAGEGALVYHGGMWRGNLWVNARGDFASSSAAAAAVGSPTPSAKVWLDLAETLIPDREEREHVLSWMAFVLQNPGRKINHMILHGGTPGCGKDTFWKPFFDGIGEANVRQVANHQLSESFNPWVKAEVIHLPELRQSKAADRRALENVLKPLLAAPPMVVMSNEKFQPLVTVLNRFVMVAHTNDEDALVLSDDDRRVFHCWSDAPPLTEAEAILLHSWYTRGDNSGTRAVLAWLYARDVSAFNPSAAPLHTEAKQNLIEEGRTPLEEALLDIIERREGVFASGVVLRPWVTAADAVMSTGLLPDAFHGQLAYAAKALPRMLKLAGWQTGERSVSAHGEKLNTRFMYSPDHAAKLSAGETNLTDLAKLARRSGEGKIMGVVAPDGSIVGHKKECEDL